MLSDDQLRYIMNYGPIWLGGLVLIVVGAWLLWLLWPAMQDTFEGRHKRPSDKPSKVRRVGAAPPPSEDWPWPIKSSNDHSRSSQTQSFYTR